MTWSVTISGHIGSRETERNMVEALRNLIRDLNSDATLYASHAVVTTTYHGRIDLLAPEDDVQKPAIPMVEAEGAENIKTDVEDTNLKIQGSEKVQSADAEKGDPSDNPPLDEEPMPVDDTPEKDEESSSKSVQSLDELTSKASSRAAKSTSRK